MAQPAAFFQGKNLKTLVEKLDISPEQKIKIKKKISKMGLENRGELLISLWQIYLLGLEEEKVLEQIEEFWQS